MAEVILWTISPEPWFWLMHFSRMAFLFPYSVKAAGSPFCQCSLVLLHVWDGKGCLGVSQDTPSAWGRGSCQPDSPFPASLGSLWLRFKQNIELKQEAREGAQSGQTSSLNTSLRGTRTCHSRAVPSYVCFLFWKHLPGQAPRQLFLPSHGHIVPELELGGSLHLLVGKASLRSQHHSWASLGFFDSRKALTRWYDSARVSTCSRFPFRTEGGVRGRRWTFLGNNTETQTLCFKVLCGFSSLLDIALVAELLPILTCWLYESQALSPRKGTGWIEEFTAFFTLLFHYS